MNWVNSDKSPLKGGLRQYIVTTHPFSCVRQQAAREFGVMGALHLTVLRPPKPRSPMGGGSRQYISQDIQEKLQSNAFTQTVEV